LQQWRQSYFFGVLLYHRNIKIATSLLACLRGDWGRARERESMSRKSQPCFPIYLLIETERVDLERKRERKEESVRQLLCHCACFLYQIYILNIFSISMWSSKKKYLWQQAGSLFLCLYQSITTQASKQRGGYFNVSVI
jgi:hypothetical protein